MLNKTVYNVVRREVRIPKAGPRDKWGIEVEVEADNLPNNIDGWVREHDGSLRGNSCEWVFDGPASQRQTIQRLNDLNRAYENAGTVIHDSPRTSVHVHRNVQDLTVKQLGNVIMMYVIAERSMLAFCDKGRRGNLFCLDMVSAEYQFNRAVRAFSSNRLGYVSTSNIRYSALNLTSLFKFGTIEFRALQGTGDVGLIKEWLGIIDRLVDAALGFDNPAAIYEHPDLAGLLGTIMGDKKVVLGELSSFIEFAYLPDWEKEDED